MLRIKQIGTICFAISILISAPLFATDIPSNAVTADCKHTPLQVYSGTSNLQAGWQANTIQLHWYNGDTEIQNVPVTSQSCTYDSTLTPPSTIPTRIGYTFRGWRAYDPMRGLQNVYIGAASNVYADKPLNGGADETAGGATAATYGLTNPGEWGVSYNYGDVTGVAKCSALAGDSNSSTWTNANSNWTATESELDSASGEQKYCWCKLTSFTPIGGERGIITGSDWIYRIDDKYCDNTCARVCGGGSAQYDDLKNVEYRMAMYNSQDKHILAYLSQQNSYTGFADKPLNGGADETAGGATAATYGLTNPGEWGVSYNYGDVTGVAKCSALAGDNNNSTWTNANSNWTATESELDSASGEKQYCWCKATGYTPGGGIKVDITSSNWIYSEDFGAKCAAVCSSVCANDLSGSGNYKKAFFYTY